MRSRGLHRVIAIAAHFALLLAVCAPVVSRLLMIHDMGSGGASHAAAMHDIHNVMTMPDGTVMPAHPPGGKTPMDACGYCSFFAHAPISPTIVPTMAILPPLPALIISAIATEVFRPVAHAPFRARGPPHYLVVS